MRYIKMNENYQLIAWSFLFVLGLLCWMVSQKFTPFIRFEQQTRQLFQQQFGQPQMNYSDGWLNSVLTFLVTYGSATFLSIATSIIGALLFLTGDRSLGIWFIGVVSTGGLFGVLLKNIFQRNRPLEHLPFDQGFSFPSGHAIASSLFFLSLLFVFLPMIQHFAVRTGLTILVLFAWGGILFSRLYFHAHHLGDLLAGVSLAFFWVTTSIVVHNKVVDVFQQYWMK